MPDTHPSARCGALVGRYGAGCAAAVALSGGISDVQVRTVFRVLASAAAPQNSALPGWLDIQRERRSLGSKQGQISLEPHRRCPQPRRWKVDLPVSDHRYFRLVRDGIFPRGARFAISWPGPHPRSARRRQKGLPEPGGRAASSSVKLVRQARQGGCESGESPHPSGCPGIPDCRPHHEH